MVRSHEALSLLVLPSPALEQVLVVNCGATPHLALAFLPARMVFAHSLVVFPYETHASFCVLQSRPHEIWARFFGSSMKDDLRYTPSDCFETFPFPDGWDTDPIFEAAGRSYYDFRAQLMIRNDEGLTKTYNRFHDPYEEDPEIKKLRELHAAMDRAVLNAYGWTDIPIDSEFLLDYEIDEEEWGNKKKPYRYRWSGRGSRRGADPIARDQRRSGRSRKPGQVLLRSAIAPGGRKPRGNVETHKPRRSSHDW